MLYFKRYLLLILLTSLYSCSEIIDDCLLFPSKPKIKTSSISNGIIGHEFYQAIDSEVKNSLNDDGFIYDYTLNGKLPKGLVYSVYGRSLIIEGIPSETGVFNIEVSLTIDEDCYEYNADDEFDCDSICFSNDTVSKSFEFKIN